MHISAGRGVLHVHRFGIFDPDELHLVEEIIACDQFAHFHI